MNPESILIIVLGGAFAGVLGSLLGLGGGIVLIPFLVLVLDIPMHQAIATSIVAVIATSSAGAAMNVERRTVNIRLGMVLETVTVLGALGGGLTASVLSGTALTRIFSVLLIVLAGVMVVDRGAGDPLPSGEPAPDSSLSGEFPDEAEGKTIRYRVRRLGGTMAVSLFAGNVSGLLGLGGGIFKVPAMHLLSGVPLKAATATSNFMIGVTAAAGAFVYLAEGHLNAHIAAPAALGVLGGSMIGVRLSGALKATVLKRIFVVVMIAAAIQLLAR